MPKTARHILGPNHTVTEQNIYYATLFFKEHVHVHNCIHMRMHRKKSQIQDIFQDVERLSLGGGVIYNCNLLN